MITKEMKAIGKKWLEVLKKRLYYKIWIPSEVEMDQGLSKNEGLTLEEGREISLVARAKYEKINVGTVKHI